MKKIILSIAMLTSVAFVSCSDDDDNNSSCKTCKNIAETGIDIEVCDNENGTATITTSFGNKVISSEVTDIPEGETVDSLECSDFDDIDIDLDTEVTEVVNN